MSSGLSGPPIGVKVDPLHPEGSAVGEIAGVLQKSGLVVFPTETFYALGAHAFQPDALEKIFKLKGRPASLPLLCLIDGLDRLNGLVREVPEWSKPLIEAFWPGPLTLILPALDAIPRPLVGPSGGVAVRWTSHPVARALVGQNQAPVTGTSANLSGRPPAVSIAQITPDILKGVDGLLDGGMTEGGSPSTVIDCTRLPQRILREGAVSVKSLRGFLIP